MRVMLQAGEADAAEHAADIRVRHHPVGEARHVLVDDRPRARVEDQLAQGLSTLSSWTDGLGAEAGVGAEVWAGAWAKAGAAANRASVTNADFSMTGPSGRRGWHGRHARKSEALERRPIDWKSVFGLPEP